MWGTLYWWFLGFNFWLRGFFFAHWRISMSNFELFNCRAVNLLIFDFCTFFFDLLVDVKLIHFFEYLVGLLLEVNLNVFLLLIRVVFFEVILLMSYHIHKLCKMLVQVNAHRIVQSDSKRVGCLSMFFRISSCSDVNRIVFDWLFKCLTIYVLQYA